MSAVNSEEETTESAPTLTLDRTDVESLYLLAGCMYGLVRGNIHPQAAAMIVRVAGMTTDLDDLFLRMHELMGGGQHTAEELNAEAEALGLPFRLSPKPSTPEITGYEIP